MAKIRVEVDLLKPLPETVCVGQEYDESHLKVYTQNWSMRVFLRLKKLQEVREQHAKLHGKEEEEEEHVS